MEAGKTKRSLDDQVQSISKCQSVLVPEIKTVKGFEIALIEIVKILTVSYPNKAVTIAVLSQTFYHAYRESVRAVIQSLCLDVTLIELIQTSPSLHIEKVDNEWRIAVIAHLVE